MNSAQTKPALTPAQRQLVSDHREIAVKVAMYMNRRTPPSITFDELFSVAVEGLIKAARLFDPSTGSRFEDYARKGVRGAVYDELRREGGGSGEVARIKEVNALEWRRQRRDIATETFLNLREPIGPLRSMVDVEHVQGEGSIRTVSAETAIDAVRMREKVCKAMEELGTNERHVVRISVIEGRTLDEAAAALGVVRSTACRIRQQALDLLRMALDADRPESAPSPASGAARAEPADQRAPNGPQAGGAVVVARSR